MTLRLAALSAAVVSALLLAAGCGGGSSGGKTTASVLGASTSMGTTVEMQPACRQLTAATGRAISHLGMTLSGFTSIQSTKQLAQHTKALQHQISLSSSQIESVQTPPGPLTRDKHQLTAGLSSLTQRLATARHEAASGNVAAAARDFASLAQLTELRHAAGSLARDCPAG